MQALARARRPDGEHGDDVLLLDDAGRDAGREASDDGAGVAAGGGDARRADEVRRAAVAPPASGSSGTPYVQAPK